MIKLIASRAENALLDSKGHFDRSALQDRLDQLKARQGALVINSSKPYSSLLTKFGSLNGPVDYIAENGAQVVCNGVNLAEKFVEPELYEDLIGWLARKSDFDGAHLILSGQMNAYTDLVKGTPEFKKMKGLYASLRPIHSWNVALFDQIYQVVIVPGNLDPDQLQSLVESKFGNRLNAVKGKSGVIYLRDTDVNLEKSLKKLEDHLKIRARKVAAIGQTRDDFDMLKAAKYGYAVKNAVPSLQNLAEVLPDDNDHQAVIKQIDKLLKNVK